MRCLSAVLVVQILLPPALAAQHNVRWWEAALVVGAVGAASAFDRTADDYFQNQRSAHSNDIARLFRHGGQPEVVLTIGGGLVVAGVITHDAGLRRSGGRVLGSVLAAQLTSIAIKELTGRVRPADARDPYVFKPFSRHEAFPSGHTTGAFALAGALSAELHHPAASVVLYAAAAGTGWSRLNDHRHWLSDVLGGAALGITAAQVIEGRWRVFGLGPPRVLVDPARRATRLEWRVAF